MTRSRPTAVPRSALLYAAVLAAFLGPAEAAAQEPGVEGDRAWDIRLGGGALFKPDYEGSDDYELEPLPFWSITYRDTVFLHGPLLGANLLTLEGPLGEDSFRAGPVARYRFGRDEDDNDALRGLGDVDGSIELGAFVSYRLASWSLGLTVLQDVSGGHEGLTADLSAGHSLRLSPELQLRSELSATWASGSYMESFFGISASQARRSGLREHEAEAGFKDVGLSLDLQYALTRNWELTGRVAYQRLLGDAADSPIVEDEGTADQFMLGLFVSYRF